jgi:hypothetical protein
MRNHHQHPPIHSAQNSRKPTTVRKSRCSRSLSYGLVPTWFSAAGGRTSYFKLAITVTLQVQG